MVTRPGSGETEGPLPMKVDETKGQREVPEDRNKKEVPEDKGRNPTEGAPEGEKRGRGC